MSVGSEIAFVLFSAIVTIAAWRVVAANDVMRAALALVVVLCGMTPLFLLLAAEFVAIVQVLVYVGAVVILFLFGIMLTRSHGTAAHSGKELNYARRWPAAILALLLLAILAFASIDAFKDHKPEVETIGTTSLVGRALLTDHVIAFEAVSVLLLAALIGAIVLARREP